MNANENAEHTLAEIALAKKTIQKAVTDAISRLSGETGFCPSRIHMNMIETTFAGSPHNTYIVGRVEMEFRL